MRYAVLSENEKDLKTITTYDSVEDLIDNINFQIRYINPKIVMLERMKDGEFKILASVDFFSSMKKNPDEIERILKSSIEIAERTPAAREGGFFQPRPVGDEVASFLSIRFQQGGPEEQTFFKKLEIILKKETTFFSDKSNKFEIAFNLRHNPEYINVLKTHWQLATAFLTKIANSNQDQSAKVLNSRLGLLYRLNNLRRTLIPEEIRRQNLQSLQQAHILNALRRQKREEPLTPPELVETFRERLIQENDIDIPKDLVCPLSALLFKDPVCIIETERGNKHYFYFEKEYLLLHLKTCKVNPLTRKPIDIKAVNEPSEEALQKANEKKDAVEMFKKEIVNDLKNENSPPQP